MLVRRCSPARPAPPGVQIDARQRAPPHPVVLHDFRTSTLHILYFPTTQLERKNLRVHPEELPRAGCFWGIAPEVPETTAGFEPATFRPKSNALTTELCRLENLGTFKNAPKRNTT